MIGADLRRRYTLPFNRKEILMVTLGLDPHPGTHTVVALDLNGSLVVSLTVLNTAAGIAQLQDFAGQFSLRRWAIEGAGNHFITGFVKQLLENGEAGSLHLSEPDEPIPFATRTEEE